MKVYPVKAFQNGTPLVDYRAVVKDGLLTIEQPIGDEWFCCGGWHIATLLQRPHDTLIIDSGYKWYVEGMTPIYHELAAELDLVICCNSTHKVGTHCWHCGNQED